MQVKEAIPNKVTLFFMKRKKKVFKNKPPLVIQGEPDYFNYDDGKRLNPYYSNEQRHGWHSGSKAYESDPSPKPNWE